MLASTARRSGLFLWYARPLIGHLRSRANATYARPVSRYVGSSRVDGMTPRHRTAVISGPQIRAARGFLCWDQRDLAMMARVPLFTVEQLETGQESTGPLVSAVAAIQGALEAAGIIFTNGDEPGVKLKARVKAKR